jgi:DNA-binding transcriptional MerR regulator
MEGSARAVYSIGAVAKMLGVAPGTIRTWQDRYGLVQPERSSGGQRLFSREQVEHLRFVKTRLDEGMQPADAHRLLAEMLERPSGGATSPGGPPGPRILILLAEWDRHAADLADYFLRTEGFQVEVSFDAADTTMKFGALNPDLTVVDLLISSGEGIEVCQELRARSGAPILAVSTLGARDEALAAGADAFLQKPLDPLQLISTVRDLLGSSAILRRVSAPL